MSNAPAPKVLVCVPTAEFARQAIFYGVLSNLRLPEGSQTTFTAGQSPARNRNIMIKIAIDGGFSHVMFFDDDLIFMPDVVERLLAHDKDIVTGLYVKRNYPHEPIIYSELYEAEGAKVKWYLPKDGENGLVEVFGGGLGLLLVKTEVFKNLEQPWITIGQREKDHWHDDLDLFIRLNKLGYKVYCDLSVTASHMAVAGVFPFMGKDGKWMVGYDTFGQGKVTFRAPYAALLEHMKQQEELVGK